MRFRPLGPRVVVKRKDEKTTKTGIILPDNSKEKPLEGTVMSIGDEVENIEIGETVLYGKYSGSDITIDGEDYILLMLEDVQGILDPEE